MKNKTILVADNQDVRRRETGKILTDGSHTIIYAPHGRQAVNICRTAPPDIVLLCLDMPVMDGFTAGKKIRELCPRLPIILLTPMADFYRQDDAIMSVFDDVLDLSAGQAHILNRVNWYLKINDAAVRMKRIIKSHSASINF
ncbi:MAG: response regulator [Bacteroidota bacterium]